MPHIQFEGLAQSLQRLPQVLQTIPDVLRDPSANPLQAVILLSMAVVLVLVALLSVILIIMRPSGEEEELYDTSRDTGAAGDSAKLAGSVASKPKQTQPFAWLTVTSIIILVVAAVWVTAGITSASQSVCTSCHANTAHNASKADDPHASVSCVSCHESGGPVARATVNLATRIQHFVVAGSNNTGLAGGFGRPVASDACARCHRSQITGVFYDSALKVRISHKEPIAAGAACVDCHVLNSGVVTATTVGMAPCLRCHDGKQAKAQCSVCHVGDPSEAIRPSVAPTEMASVQVPNPQCTGCHKDMTKCNACHGISMPHSVEFKQFAHARPASIAIWDNNLQVCRKCHYPGHNDCQQNGCHMASFPSHPSPEWRTMHSDASWSQSSATCSCHAWNAYDHNGMNYCQICHTVKPKNARP